MMNAELAKNLREPAAEDYLEGSLQKYIESATFVNLRDCMLFQKKGRDKSVDVVVRKEVSDLVNIGKKGPNVAALGYLQ
jgi:hypothetical protein